MVKYPTCAAAFGLAIDGLLYFLGIGVYFALIEMADLPDTTTLLSGAVEEGDSVIRVFPVLTAVAGAGFVASVVVLDTLFGECVAGPALVGESLADLTPVARRRAPPVSGNLVYVVTQDSDSLLRRAVFALCPLAVARRDGTRRIRPLSFIMSG